MKSVFVYSKQYLLSAKFKSLIQCRSNKSLNLVDITLTWEISLWFPELCTLFYNMQLEKTHVSVTSCKANQAFTTLRLQGMTKVITEGKYQQISVKQSICLCGYS